MVYGAAPAGYSEYYVPGDEDSMMYILDTIGGGDQTTPNTMHAEITVTAWSANTTVYYDHWEDGYDFDPDNPTATADETVTLTNRGDSNSFQGNNIPLPRTTAASCSPAGTCYYDGRDRFYVAGGSATVSRASWTDMAGTTLAVAWEVYPVRPQLTTYILPFGEDLAAGGLQDFDRVFALVQATSNSTTITVDFNGDGTPDDIDPDRDGDCSDATTSVTLNQGEVYVVDDLSNCSAYVSLNTGTIVKGTNTLQVQYVIGDQGSTYEIRGFSAFPRGLWDDEYYAPVDGPNPSTTNPVDIYLHNPHASALTINYETTATTGSFSIPAKSTVSFEAETGSYVPTDSAVYLKGSDVFWGVSSIDVENTAYDWGYSLVPAFLLSDEYFMGWAPGYYPPPTDFDASGIFITAAQENLLVFIDTDNDGTVDQTYTLDRLQTQYVYDPVDGDMSDANIWATGPITIAYGQNSDTAPAAAPAIDVGYTTIPGGNFIDKVMTVDKSADPVVVPVAAGSTTTFTLEINSYNFSIDDISVSDLLPAGWEYVDDSTTITLADKSTVSGDSADPTLTVPTPNEYRDYFETTAYNNNSDNQPGTLTWDTDWNEEGEADGAAAGIIQVSTDTGVTPNAGGLHFDYTLSTQEYNDYFETQVYDNNSDNTPAGTVWSTDWNEETFDDGPTAGIIQVSTDTGVTPNAGAMEIDFSQSESLAYQDNFGTSVYDNNGDNIPAGINWTTDWNEDGEGTNPNWGDIQIENDGAFGSVLRIKDNNRAIARMADLSGLDPSTITLSFDYRRDSSIDTATDYVDVQVCETAVDGGDVACSDGGGWTTVTTIAGPTDDATYQSFSVDLDTVLTNPDSADFAIRFSSDGSNLGNSDYIYFDNLAISGTFPAVTTKSISRMADLSDMLNTSLSFDYRRVSLDSASDYADIEVCENAANGTDITCPGGWVQVLRIAGPTTDSAYQNYQVDLDTLLTTPESATFAVRVTTQEDGNSSLNLFLDNLAVTGDSTPTYSIARMADLSGMSDTYLSIDYRRLSLDSASDYADIEVCENATNGADITCPGGWVQALRIAGPTTDSVYQNYRVDLDSLIATTDSATFAVRVTTEDDNDGDFDLFIDNVIVGEMLPSTLDWPSSLLGSMGANQQIIITFDAQTTKDFSAADITRNLVEAEGTRSVGAATQTFIASDFAYNTFGDFEVSKTSDGVDPLSPGDTYTYTVTINNTSSTETLTGIAVYDPIPNGISYVAASASVTAPSGSAVHDPPNFIAEDDNYQLAPGQSMTLTFDVLVDDPLPSGLDEITNTASVTTNEFLLPVTASVTNTVLNPSTSSASVGDRVWLDTDGDGVLDVGESGLPNIEVTLKDQFGTPVDTVYTDSNGNFLFTGVTPDTGYYVQVTGGIPAGLQQSAPAGHSDDSTEPFDLSSGDVYLAADLGYTPTPGTATFGNLVWSDADSDGVHDSGEPGISGVTVAIYLDDGDEVFEPGADDTLVTTTVTAADGTYMFAGVTASGTEDYFIYVDNTQAALTNYSNTTPVSLLELDVDAGDSFSNFDFGFNNTSDTNSIRDRVWIDTNGDDEDDGESGIAGVTVALLDSSRNVIATTTTDASGYFEFNGVYDNNADYTIQITDTFGVLTDYYGTSAAAIAGEMDIDNLSSDIDNTVEPSEPNFAYAIKSAIGGTVFNDLDGDGVQDAGELGLAGIDVELYLDDGTTPGVLDGSDTLLYTDTTGAGGSYIFSGLADNDYIISITGIDPLVYTYTSESPDDDPAAGEQQAETIASASSNMAVDFGYQAVISRATSGTVWNDSNADGSIDGGETLFENVTLDLYLDDGDSLFDSGLDTLSASVSTDASGDFNFSGLTPGVYWIVITDSNSILAGYDPAYEVTEGVAPPFNSREMVDLSSGDQNSINFGFFKPVPTLVVITDFRALVGADGQVIIEWTTGSELDTIGFYLYRFDPRSKEYSNVRENLLPAEISAPQGSTYQLVDREAVPGRLYMYRLVEQERNGKTRSYGPFTVLPGIPASAARTADKVQDIDGLNDHSKGFRRAARKVLQKKNTPVRTKDRSFSNTNRRSRSAQDEALKISVTEAGIYYLSAGEIASLLGKKEKEIRNLIRRGRLSLQNRGREVAWLQDDGDQGLIFYGQAIDSLYTRENIYLLHVENGMVMDKKENGRRRDRIAVKSLSFSSTLHIEEDHYPVAAYASNPESDYWYWDFVYGGAAGLDSRSFSFEVPEVADLAATAFLKLVLTAATDTSAANDHHVIISLNGTVMGAERWDGLKPHTAEFSFYQDLLHEGLNSLEITALLDSGVPYSVVGLDSFELTYERRYMASDNTIEFQGEKEQVINIGGFTDNNVLLFDITNPLVPVQFDKLQIDGIPGNYEVEFRPGSPTDKYLAATENTLAAPDAVSPVLPAGLRNPANRADYLIITTEELSAAAQSLADYRSAEGLKTMIVTLEDIMNEFNHGISSPLAIRDFLQYASERWTIAPRFVVLAGDGTYDYRDLMGNGDNLVPTLMVPTPNGLNVSDTSFADLDGDGLPEMAVGRLPAQDPEDLMAMIDKIMAYEKNGGDWRNRMIYAADDPDAGGNFTEDSEFIAALAPMNYDLRKIYLTEQSLDLARSNIINGINNGAAYLNYIGHAATDRLAQEGILRIEDVAALNSQSGHPLILAMTCAVGQFALPGWEALSEALMRKAAGGATAIWSPTGYSYNHEAMILNEEFHWIVFRDGEKILGNAILQTLRNYRDRGGQPHISAIYTLLGDPALHLGSTDYGQRRRKR